MIEFLNKIASQSIEPSSEHLQILGKRAASSYVQKNASSLNNAVKTVIDEESLNNDQVQRVVEMANQAAWKHMFVETGDREVDFEPASVSSVMESDQEVQEVSSPSLDYLEDAGSNEDVNFGEVFKIDKPNPEYESLNPAAEEIQTHEKAASAANFASHGIDILIPEMSKVAEEFYNEFKQGYLQYGNGVIPVAKIIAQVTGNEKFASAITSSAVDRMKKEGIYFSAKKEIEKSAEELVADTDHPLLHKAVLLEKLSAAYNNARKDQKNLTAKKKTAYSALRDKLRE